MSNKEMKTRIVHKHDLEKNWDTASNFNFIPWKGEIIIYDIETSVDDLPEGRTTLYNYERIKIGDGETVVKNLPFVSQPIATEDDIIALLELHSTITTMSDSTGYIYQDLDEKILVI
jgi:hypothetical protein